VDNEGVYAHAVVSPGGVIGILHADVEEDDGVEWGRIERLLGVGEDGRGWDRVGVWILVVVAVVMVKVGGKGDFGIGAAVDFAVIKRVPETGENERASPDKGVTVCEGHGRDVKNVERAIFDV
jgi:hypothetical protein